MVVTFHFVKLSKTLIQIKMKTIKISLIILPCSVTNENMFCSIIDLKRQNELDIENSVTINLDYT